MKIVSEKREKEIKNIFLSASYEELYTCKEETYL
jgi:hypothetical protein